MLTVRKYTKVYWKLNKVPRRCQSLHMKSWFRVERFIVTQ